MSKQRPEIDFNPLLRKVQNDISLLCYLGLHQYAKDNKLIGRSRPMIGPNIDFLMQKRLNFRLVVACIQQIIGSKTYLVGSREEQINYVNVGEYSVLRLYGLLDQDMFTIKTSESSTISSWWPEQFVTADKEMLRSATPIKAFHGDLAYNTRACLEIGGEIFTNNLRNALKHIPLDLIDFKPHAQRDPKNRMVVKNIAVPLRLVEKKQFHQRHGYTVRIPGQDTGPNTVFIPSHIEQLLHFRHVLWPWIQSLQTPNVKESFQYIANNFPSLHAVQLKIRSIRESTAERERRERLREGEEARREANVEQLRERIVARYGEPDPGVELHVYDEHGEDIPNNVTLELRGLEDEHVGPQIEHIHGHHGRELEPPGAAFDRRVELGGGLYIAPDAHHGIARDIDEADEDEPYHPHVNARFLGDEVPATPGVLIENPRDNEVEQYPLPPNNIEEIAEGVRERIARALGQQIVPVEEEDDVDPEIPF